MHMKLVSFLFVSFLAYIAPSTVKASVTHGESLHLQSGRHVDLAKRVEGNMQLYNRGTGSKWTFYDVQQSGQPGSCGQLNVNTDYTVAMNAAQMTSSWCFKTITMRNGGKTTTARITDTCLGCAPGGLDLTEGLFAYFFGHWPIPSVGGVLTGDWEFADATPVEPAPVKATTTKPVLTTTIKPVVDATSSIGSKKIISTSSVSTKSSNATATTSVDYLSGAASGLAVPTGTIDTATANGPNNLQELNRIFIGLSGLAMAARNI